MRIVVMYEDGRVWNCEADPCGDGDAGEVVAVAGAVALDSRGLTFAPRVLPWESGAWRMPSGVVEEWSANEPNYTVVGGERIDYLDATRCVRHVEREGYQHGSYVLLAPGQLDGAVSVTVDGVLAFASEGGALVPVTGGGGAAGGEGMVDQFAKSNHPASYGAEQSPFAPRENATHYGFGR